MAVKAPGLETHKDLRLNPISVCLAGWFQTEYLISLSFSFMEITTVLFPRAVLRRDGFENCSSKNKSADYSAQNIASIHNISGFYAVFHT